MPREYQSGLMSHPVPPVSSTAVSLALRPTTSDFQPPPPPLPFETLSSTPSLFRRFTAPVLPAFGPAHPSPPSQLRSACSD